MATGQRDVNDPNLVYPNILRWMENTPLAFLQAIFGGFPAGRSPSAYHYDDNGDATEIEIEGQNTDNLASVDHRPKITVARGPVAWANTHINNFVGSKNLSVENRRFAAIHRGTIGISCFSKSDLEADHIAQICFDSIMGFAPQLQRLGFLSIKASQIGQRGMIRSDVIPNLFVTPVLVQVEISREWTMKKLDPVKMREILVQLVTKP